MENRCVACGDIIPEGRMVCHICMEIAKRGCQECEGRYPGCHGNCPTYAVYKKVNDAKKRPESDRWVTATLEDIEIRRMRKVLRRKNRK